MCGYYNRKRLFCSALISNLRREAFRQRDFCNGSRSSARIVAQTEALCHIGLRQSELHFRTRLKHFSFVLEAQEEIRFVRIQSHPSPEFSCSANVFHHVVTVVCFLRDWHSSRHFKHFARLSCCKREIDSLCTNNRIAVAVVYDAYRIVLVARSEIHLASVGNLDAECYGRVARLIGIDRAWRNQSRILNRQLSFEHYCSIVGREFVDSHVLAAYAEICPFRNRRQSHLRPFRFRKLRKSDGIFSTFRKTVALLRAGVELYRTAHFFQLDIQADIAGNCGSDQYVVNGFRIPPGA